MRDVLDSLVIPSIVPISINAMAVNCVIIIDIDIIHPQWWSQFSVLQCHQLTQRDNELPIKISTCRGFSIATFDCGTVMGKQKVKGLSTCAVVFYAFWGCYIPQMLKCTEYLPTFTTNNCTVLCVFICHTWSISDRISPISSQVGRIPNHPQITPLVIMLLMIYIHICI